MSMQDPISDMISRVMNAQARRHATVSFSSSKIKNAICSVLEKEGFISSFKIEGEESKKTILVSLKYHQESPVIKELKRISKPGLRKYFSSKEIPSVRNGLGVGIITTSKGVLTDKEAREHGVGGELICTVF